MWKITRSSDLVEEGKVTVPLGCEVETRLTENWSEKLSQQGEMTEEYF